MDNIDSIETSITDHNLIKVVTCIPKSPLKKNCLNPVTSVFDLIILTLQIGQILMTPSVSLIGIVNLEALVTTKCYPKLPVWWATYVRKTVNASSVAGDADPVAL